MQNGGDPLAVLHFGLRRTGRVLARVAGQSLLLRGSVRSESQ